MADQQQLLSVSVTFILCTTPLEAKVNDMSQDSQHSFLIVNYQSSLIFTVQLLFNLYTATLLQTREADGL